MVSFIRIAMIMGSLHSKINPKQIDFSDATGEALTWSLTALSASGWEGLAGLGWVSVGEKSQAMNIQEKAKLLLFAHTNQPSINPHTWAWCMQIMTLSISQAPAGLGVLSRAMSGLPLLPTVDQAVRLLHSHAQVLRQKFPKHD